MDEVLPKPVNLEVLKEILHEIILKNWISIYDGVKNNNQQFLKISIKKNGMTLQNLLLF